MAVAISVETFSVSLWIIRNPTDLIVEAMVSVILLLRVTVKRMLANFTGVMLLSATMRAFCTRKVVTPSTSLTGPELEDRVAKSSALGRVVAGVLVELALHILALV